MTFRIVTYLLARLIVRQPHTARHIIAWAAGELALRSDNVVSVRKAA